MTRLGDAVSPLRQVLRVASHFVASRGVEVGALQASPLLGAYLGGMRGEDVGRLGLVLAGSVALTAHVFVFNDWADFEQDSRVDRRANAAVDAYGISRAQIGRAAAVLLAVAIAMFALVGVRAVMVGAGIALLSFLYSASNHFGKRMPIAATLNHVIGGTLHFLLGYTAMHAVDARGLVLGLFFALVFAAGHLNQEIRDHELDAANQIRTSSVTFGRRPTFLASCALFTGAYALLGALGWFGVVPPIVGFVALGAWLLQAAWSVRAVRHGLDMETALWLQRRYRLLFAVVGLTLLLS
jgi:4-hydroxybenzoate polyprenyltransferase